MPNTIEATEARPGNPDGWDFVRVSRNWLLAIAVLGLSAYSLRLLSPLFGPDIYLIDMPVIAFVVFFLALGIGFWFAIPLLVEKTGKTHQTALLAIIMVSGLFLRLLFLDAPAVMESDYNRYLWDGAVTANGINPYANTPDDIFNTAQPGDILYDLQEQSGGTFDRINHPQFSTVYPPVAQAIFALSYIASPFSLDTLRLVLILLEAATAFVVLNILILLGRSPLWVSVFWLNPLVIKETANSAHMEPLLMFPVMVAIWLVLKNRLSWASLTLAIAAGVKIWPMLLAFPLWRQMLKTPKQLIINMALCGFVVVLLLLPILLAGLSSKSGFIAFAGQWNSSSAFYLVVHWFVSLLAPASETAFLSPALLARALLGISLLAIIAVLCLRPANNTQALIGRMFLITVSLYLLAPSHTPWYFLWLAPFLCIYPVRGLMLAGATLSMHYLYFHFSARDMEDLYHLGVVWLIWLPVWAVLAYDLYKGRYKRLVDA